MRFYLWARFDHHPSLRSHRESHVHSCTVAENGIWKETVSPHREYHGPPPQHKGTSVAPATLCNLWTISWGLFLTRYDCSCGKPPGQLSLRAAIPQRSHLASGDAETSHIEGVVKSLKVNGVEANSSIISKCGNVCGCKRETEGCLIRWFWGWVLLMNTTCTKSGFTSIFSGNIHPQLSEWKKLKSPNNVFSVKGLVTGEISRCLQESGSNLFS